MHIQRQFSHETATPRVAPKAQSVNMANGKQPSFALDHLEVVSDRPGRKQATLGAVSSKTGNWGKENPMPTTPNGQAMVLTANLREGLVLDPGDVQDPSDMRNFAERVARLAPYAPDVLTLSEVIGPSAENVRRLLSEKTGHNYVIVQAPGRSAYESGAQTKDTAILVNADTIAIEKSGYIRGSKPGGTNLHAYAVLRRKGSDLRLNVASIHFPTSNSYGMSREAAFKERVRMGTQVRNFMSQLQGKGPSINVIAGDFNNIQEYKGKETPLYHAMTGQWGYKDSLLTASSQQVHSRRLDYVYTDGEVVDAERDHTYDKKVRQSGFVNGGADDSSTGLKREKRNPTHYYSDHAYEWAVVGKPKG